MAAGQPGFSELAVDSLGKAKLAWNAMLPLRESGSRYAVTRVGSRFEYRAAGSQGPAAWTFEFGSRKISIRSAYNADSPPQPLVLGFDPFESHATLLGLFDAGGAMALPALLHFPDRGTLRITTPAKDVAPGYHLSYDALRDGENFVRVTFPAATAERPAVAYSLEVTAIYPHDARVDGDARYDGYRRNFLNILQVNPRYRVLANNAASDPVPFTVFLYSMMAIHMPPLADGLSALDILRQTLDRYAGGMKGYGMTGYNGMPVIKYDFLDVYPSLVLAAGDYVSASGDRAWLLRNYATVKGWADQMIEFDRDGDGLMEYPVSGNAGSWTKKITVRPANWWDTIGFGHKDAYSNALAYAAFLRMAALSGVAGQAGDAGLFQSRADKLKAVYYTTFYNPATGVLAGWKSADGRLHDYYFLFVNGMAVTYGLVSREQGNAIWNKLLAKMREVGYRRFDLGLPGNLVPVRREDYVDLDRRYGGPEREDGADGFQIYENGGASACYAYFTIQALRDLGRGAEADEILFPMLKAFEDGGFQGRGANGLTYDWKDWQGGPHGYEGLLVDGYLTLLSAMPGNGKK
jgi:hypothetical protein